jgi:hypothetical protein
MPNEAFTGNVAKIAQQLNAFEKTGVTVLERIPFPTNSGQSGVLVVYEQAEEPEPKAPEPKGESPVETSKEMTPTEAAIANAKAENAPLKRKPGRPKKETKKETK